MGAHAFGRNSGKKTEMMINFFPAEKRGCQWPMMDVPMMLGRMHRRHHHHQISSVSCKSCFWNSELKKGKKKRSADRQSCDCDQRKGCWSQADRRRGRRLLLGKSIDFDVSSSVWSDSCVTRATERASLEPIIATTATAANRRSYASEAVQDKATDQTILQHALNSLKQSVVC